MGESGGGAAGTLLLSQLRSVALQTAAVCVCNPLCMLRSHLGLQYASDSLPTTNQTAAAAPPPPSRSYDVEGRKLDKRGRRDRLERHIAMADSLGKVQWAAVGLAKDKRRLSSRAAGQWRCPTTSKRWLAGWRIGCP